MPEFRRLAQNALTFGGNHEPDGRIFLARFTPARQPLGLSDWDGPGGQTAVHIGRGAISTVRCQRRLDAGAGLPVSGMRCWRTGAPCRR